jgi:hypothetical protein
MCIWLKQDWTWRNCGMKTTAFWDIVLCSIVEVERRFRGACCIALMMEAGRTSETLANFYETTWRSIPYSPPWELEISKIEMTETQGITYLSTLRDLWTNSN